MLNPEMIEIDFVSAASGADAGDADIRVSVEGSCIVLRIASAANSADAAVPVLLSAAAGRALAAELMRAADSVEPFDDQA
jgi:hypothetical protein